MRRDADTRDLIFTLLETGMVLLTWAMILWLLR